MKSTARCIETALLFAAAVACGQAIAELGYTVRVSTALTTLYAQKFGAGVHGRVAAWKGFAGEQKKTTFSQRLESAKGQEAGTLQPINDEINAQVKWIDDKTHWRMGDYWATPAESIASAGGDCEDYSIAKYYLLKELGVPISRLRITYVRALKLNGQAHMVLTYYANPDADPLVLDNLDPVIRSASQRTDLQPVYSFNDDEVQLAQRRTRGKPSQIRTWRVLQEHLIAESRT